MDHRHPCPDCDVSAPLPVPRRQFVQSAGTTAAVAVTTDASLPARATEDNTTNSDNMVACTREARTPLQRETMRFDRNNKVDGALPGTCVSSNWSTTSCHTMNMGSPFRTRDQQAMHHGQKWRGGLDRCHLSFCREDDIRNDGVRNTWRFGPPSFVRHVRSSPHVHVRVNFAVDPFVSLNATD